MSQNNSSKRDPQDKSTNQDYPFINRHIEKIFIVVKAAPNPSCKYQETVCTAGITEKRKWIRLYPLSFRYIDFNKRFSKYQWINVEIERNLKDFRIDSYRPAIGTIQPLGIKLPAGDWRERKKIILPTLLKSIEELKNKYASKKISIGIFKPKKIIKFVIEEGDREWSKKHQSTLSQQKLFGPQPKPLEKIPFKFSYEFICNDTNCSGHKMQIIDWELNELYRNMKKKYGFSLDLVLEKIKQKWFLEMCREDKDIYLIVGSVFPKPSFVVLGVFWPPKK